MYFCGNEEKSTNRGKNAPNRFREGEEKEVIRVSSKLQKKREYETSKATWIVVLKRSQG